MYNVLNIGINCYYNSNIYLLRQQLASMFVNLNEQLINETVKQTKQEKKQYNIDDDIKFKHFISSSFVYNYYKQQRQFNTIKEYIIDMLTYGFKPLKKINTKFIITLIVDGLNNELTPNFEYWYNNMDTNDFQKIKDKFKLKANYDNILYDKEFKLYAQKYYYEYWNNKNNLTNIFNTYNELKQLTINLPIDIELIGTKYHTNLMVNRNLFMQLNDKIPVKFLDDDDFSCSFNELEDLLKYVKNNNKVYAFSVCSFTDYYYPFNRSFWSIIIPPSIETKYSKTKYIYGEDDVFWKKHKPTKITIEYPIYYYFEARKSYFMYNNSIGFEQVNKKYLLDDSIDTTKYPGFELNYEHEYVIYNNGSFIIKSIKFI
jgi:hypothetical protein